MKKLLFASNASINIIVQNEHIFEFKTDSFLFGDGCIKNMDSISLNQNKPIRSNDKSHYSDITKDDYKDKNIYIYVFL